MGITVNNVSFMSKVFRFLRINTYYYNNPPSVLWISTEPPTLIKSKSSSIVGMKNEHEHRQINKTCQMVNTESLPNEDDHKSRISKIGRLVVTAL